MYLVSDSSEIEIYKQKFVDCKLTHQRRAILEVLVENGERHLNAEEILTLVKEKMPDIGLATIYRTLDLFEEMNIVNKVNFGDGCSRYELCKAETDYHHHLVCLNCGKIYEVKDDLLKKLENNIEDQHDFNINDHKLFFYGYCRDCRS